MTGNNGIEAGREQGLVSAENAGEARAALIARRAYEKWQARGCPDGDDRRDWFEAEQEIAATAGAQAKGGQRPPSRKGA